MENSPLYKLPGEIRNQVWDMALRNDEPIVLGEEGLPIPSDYRYNARRRRRNDDLGACYVDERFAQYKANRSNKKPHKIHQSLALTETCKAIRNETNNRFFDINTFHIYIEEQTVSPATRLIKLQEKLAARHAASLRVEVHFNMLVRLKMFYNAHIRWAQEPFASYHIPDIARDAQIAVGEGLGQAMDLQKNFPKAKFWFGDEHFSLQVDMEEGAVEKSYGDFVLESFHFLAHGHDEHEPDPYLVLWTHEIMGWTANHFLFTNYNRRNGGGTVVGAVRMTNGIERQNEFPRHSGRGRRSKREWRMNAGVSKRYKEM